MKMRRGGLYGKEQPFSSLSAGGAAGSRMSGSERFGTEAIL